jgi:hypothetical protein
MSDEFLPRPPRLARGRPFEKGRSGNPIGRRTGCRNKKTLAAAVLLEGESEALTRRAVELAMGGDPTAMRLCLERILPPCRERAVEFALPPIESAADIAAAMKAVTSALAAGAITPGHSARLVIATHRGVLLQIRCRSDSFSQSAQLVIVQVATRMRPFFAAEPLPSRLTAEASRHSVP